MSAAPVPLERYCQVLKENPTPLEELAHDTRYRYLRGEFPRAIRWLLKHPELMRAFADVADARPTTHDSMGCSPRVELTQPKQGQNHAEE